MAAGALAILAACSSPEDGWNLDESPTDPGAFDATTCQGQPLNEAMCVRDGDYGFWTCASSSAAPEKHGCRMMIGADNKGCYGARDSQPAVCMLLEELAATPEGIEPGSDYWEDAQADGIESLLPEKQASSSGGSGGSSGGGSAGSCCKVCRSGRACGDSCISSSKSCNTRGGCACNG